MKIVFLVADSLRADGPGYATGRGDTPFLDGLAKEGTRFAHAYASGAWTIPSLMSMLTGSLAHRVGICRWRHPYPARRPNLFTAFAAAGFPVSCFHPYPAWGLLTVPGTGAVGNSQDPKAVVRALAEPGDRFFFIHHWWTHLPYMNRELPEDRWHALNEFSIQSLGRHGARIARTLERSYRKTVAFLSDELLPRYLDAASSGGEDVLLLLTGDHGETWGKSLPPGRRVQNVYDLHGRWITDETIEVPLLIHGRSQAGALPVGRVVPGASRGVDVAPTLAALAGIPWPGPAPDAQGPGIVERPGEALDIIGESLATSILGAEGPGEREIRTVSSHNAHVPRVYPDTGVETWRTMAERTGDAWFIWDATEQSRSIVPETPGRDGDETNVIFEGLANEQLRAVDPGTFVPDDQLDALRSPVAGVTRALSSLGYLD